MRNYKQLSQAQRYQIEILNKAGKNQKEIAKLLCVSASTLCRELKRNRGKAGYFPKQAQIKADKRRKQPRIIFCSTDACFQSFGFKKQAGATIGIFGIVISPRAWKPYYVRHEMFTTFRMKNWA